MLWPRFELILEMNVQSVRSTDPQRLGGLDTRPHYVSMGRGGGSAERQGWKPHCAVTRPRGCVPGPGWTCSHAVWGRPGSVGRALWREGLEVGIAQRLVGQLRESHGFCQLSRGDWREFSSLLLTPRSRADTQNSPRLLSASIRRFPTNGPCSCWASSRCGAWEGSPAPGAEMGGSLACSCHPLFSVFFSGGGGEFCPPGGS